VTRFADERICIVQGPTWATIAGVCTGADEVESLLFEARERVPAAQETVWWIGPSSQPPDLYERLQALGLERPSDDVPLVHALALTKEPDRSQGVDVRRIE